MDAVLSDMSMPFILVSGYASPGIVGGSPLPEDVARLAKPFRQAELVTLLNELRNN